MISHSMNGIRASIVLSVLSVFAAAGAEAGSFPRTVVDDTGRKVTILQKPSRIVSVTLPTDEILLSLVDQSRLKGVSLFSLDPEISSVASKAVEIPNKVVLAVEFLVSLTPDLVFVADWSRAESVRQLRDAGVNVYEYASPTTVQGVEDGILRIGAAVGEEGKAAEIAEWMKSRLALIRSKTARIGAGERVSVLDHGAWYGSMGKGTSWDEVVRLAGCRNAAFDLASDALGQVTISEEKLLELDPDILILPTWVYGDPDGPERLFQSILSNPALKTLKAVRGGRVYRMAEKFKYSTSQYIVRGIEELARLAYPWLFKRESE